MRQLIVALLALFCVLRAPVRAQSVLPNGEYVIVTGGVSLWAWEKFKAEPHDNWWMNFVRASRIRTEEIKAQNPEAKITWLVYRPAYVSRGRQDNKDLVELINSVRDAFGIKLVYFDRGSQVIDYLNAGQPRGSVKIAGLEYFGHSNKACWMFDYSNNIDSASKAWLHEDDLGKIQRGIFAKGAFIKSWGCHTGESMSRKFRSATGLTMIGANGKTAYQTDELPIVSTPGGGWVR
jgi:hypothetical protein